MPLDRSHDLWQQARRDDGVVERTRLGIEQERIGICLRAEQARQSGTLKSGQRVLARIRVQVADDQNVGVAAAGRVARDPVCQCRRSTGARQVAVTLAVAEIRVTVGLTGGPLGLEVVNDDCQFCCCFVDRKGMCERGSIARIIEPGIYSDI